VKNQRTCGESDAVNSSKRLQSFDLGREILKWIALVTMTIDHLGAALFPDYIFMRIIGRISFPLFGYLLVLGMESTRNTKNYVARLFIFALISQAPFFLALGYPPFEMLNIFFTLSLGLLSLLKPLLILPSLLVSEFLNFDYGAYGIASIACMYILNKNTRNGIVCLVLFNAMYSLLNNIQVFSLLALPIILLYKEVFGLMKIEKKIKGDTVYPPWRKYFFYIYYPFHLSMIYLIKTFILKQ